VQCFEIQNKKNRSPRPFTRYRLKLPHNSRQFRLTNTCLFDQFTVLSIGTGSTYLKQILKQCTRCKLLITRNNLLDVLWQMLEASDGIDFKPSSRACSSNKFFSNMCFFSNSLNKKRMNVGQKYAEKKIGHLACLRVNDFSFL